jgi:hypothetical protein
MRTLTKGPIRTVVERGALTEIRPNVWARPLILECQHTIFVPEHENRPDWGASRGEPQTRSCPVCLREGKGCDANYAIGIILLV